MNKKKKTIRKEDRLLEKLLETIENLKEEGSTKKYDDDSALVGDQATKLPDDLQKAIIDKTVEDREESKEEAKEEKNENIVRCIVRKVLKNRR